MGRPLRSEQFRHDEIAIVHCVQRCVRRAFLAGDDNVSGIDYSYRREWIRRRFEALASVFAIDVLSYAILSNHLHVILRSRPDVLSNLSDEEVTIRWLRVFPGRRIEEQLAEPSQIDVKRVLSDPDQLAMIRTRLSDISWFMRALAEPIARMANSQDECTGRFWEGRFKAQRIVDDAGLLACAMYVDLNPVRAAIAESPEKSIHTSVYDRIEAEKGKQIPSAAYDLVPITHEESVAQRRKSLAEQRHDHEAKKKGTAKRVLRDSWLAPLSLTSGLRSSDPQVHRDGLRASDKGFLRIDLSSYKKLLGWVAENKPSAGTVALPKQLSDALITCGVIPEMLSDLIWNFKKYFSRCVGGSDSMQGDAERIGRRWHRGQRRAAACFS
ncbi:MAG: transposase [Pirellula sp.]|jgi:REP element-mobilizing transposase RayT